MAANILPGFSTLKVFYRGAASTTTTTTLYTTAPTETSLINNIVAVNTSTTSQTVTISVDGTALLSAVNISANSTTTIDLNLPLIASGATKTITGGASATSVNIFIGGVTY